MKADERYHKILERMKWGGLTFPSATLLCLFEKLTAVFHSAFSAGRQGQESIEYIPKILRSVLDLAVNEDLIAGLGLIEECSTDESANHVLN